MFLPGCGLRMRVPSPIGRLSSASLAIILACGAVALGGGVRLERTERYARDRLIVKLRPSAGAKGLGALRTRLRGRELRRLRSSGAIVVKLEEGVDVDDVIAAVRADPAVVYAERDHVLRLHGTVPNDPDFESCWGLDNTGQYLGEADADIDAPEAWDIATGSLSVVVAVIDTGVDYRHADLAANMWVNQAEAAGQPGVDDDGNGYVDDVHGISMLNGTVGSDPDDDHGHGTHVAGIIGAVGNNGIGMTGVVWSVRIMALKFLNSNGYGLESDAATCIDYAVANGAVILNNSYGGDTDSTPLYEAILRAGQAGVLFCTSAGNESLDNDAFPSYPASYDAANIISVASTDGADGLSYFSNTGRTTVDVGAPGESIWSTWPNNHYQLLDGTSMACPFVVGVAALVKAHEPQLSMAELRDRVMWTGDRSLDLTSSTVTGLRVNAYNALMGIYAARITTPSPLPPGEEGTPYATGLAAQGFAPPFTWTWSASGYIERETANGYSAAGTAKGWQSDEGVWQLDLTSAFPGGFPFYGQTHTHVYVCSNGYLEFADTQPSPKDFADMATFANRRVIAPYWTDLTTVGGDIFVWQQPGSFVAIRWKAEDAFLSILGITYPVNVTVVLHADGRIEMHYGPNNYALLGPMIGLSSGDGTNYRISHAKRNEINLAWALTSLWTAGSLPPGLDLGADTGIISGTPTEAGIFDFDVTAVDTSGGSDTKQFSIDIAAPNAPIADFEGTPLSGDKPLTVTFTDLSSSPTAITAWEWNFGDGSTSTDQSPQHEYPTPGKYSVSLTVTSAGGADTETKARYVDVTNPGPKVDFDASPVTGYAPLTVSFTDLTTRGGADLFVWTWNFGDNGWDQGLYWTSDASTSHDYMTPGQYDVTLEAIDEADPSGVGAETKLLYITVARNSLTVTPDEPYAAAGPVGGPMAPDTKVYTLSNDTDEAISWKYAPTGHPAVWPPTWAPVQVTPTEGILQPDQSIPVTVAIDQTGAAAMPAGSYEETVTFEDLTNGAKITRLVTLDIGGGPAPPGQLDCDMRTYVDGRLNPHGPGPTSLTLDRLDPNGNPAATLFAIRIGDDGSARWLSSESTQVASQVRAEGSAPEWRTAADWEGVRLLGLDPDTDQAFFAAAKAGDDESGLAAVGTFRTNKDCDVNRSGVVTALDYAYIRAAVLRGGPMGTSRPWPCEVTGDATADAADLNATRDKALNPVP